MTRFLWYGSIFSLVVNLITVLSPILLGLKPSNFARIVMSFFGFIVVLYLPFAFVLIYPAIFISVLGIAYVSINIFKMHNQNSRVLFFIFTVSLLLHLLAIHLRDSMRS